ncbi:tetratricopeptide repeat protein [Streptomyces sp. WMMC500]|uniref:ATP-binding protein n=1 Tax=Streptomyces sp. WMMC500 TaxID=3015154 RepID=UPI00248D2AFC|nr:tetratricopeptide repeat protein [Streptomyces sp. WMMC500]WBB58193.1 tetratricopeptide repeat protein [Streptomyces sp. WMMC500]
MAGQAQRFWAELAAAYEAAGRPTLDRLVRLGREQRPPAAIADSTLSGWLNARTVPGPAHTRYFLALTAFLQSEAGRAGRAGHPVRPEAWWGQLLAQARRERSANRGGRPAAHGSASTLAEPPLPAEARPPAAESPPAPPGPSADLSALPAPGPSFVGRGDELATLLDLLRPTPEGTAPTASPVAVSGLGGVGKTSLALHAAYEARRAGWFPGGVYFVDLHGAEESPVTADGALQALLRAFGVEPEHTPPTADERAGLYRSVLERVAADRGPALLLADNAATSSQVRPLLPGSPAHRVLTTSRNVLAQLGAHQLRLGMLAPAAALAALHEALTAADPEDRRLEREAGAAVELCRRCGHLPLALQIAAALLVADPGKPVAELADELRDMSTRMRYLDDGERAVRAAFDLSYRLLTDEQAHLFRLLALHPGADVSVAALTASYGGPLPVRGVDTLVRAHLVEPRDARGRWRMHDLVRAYAVAEVRADRRLHERHEEARTRLLAHYCDRATAARRRLLTSSAPAPAVPPQDPAGFADRDAAFAWLDAERGSLVAAARWAAEPAHARAAVRLALNLGEYFALRRRYDDAVTVYERALQASRGLGDRLSEGKCANNLGVALRWTQRLEEAVAACRTALRAYEDLPDAHAVSRGRSWHNLASTLTLLRLFDEALAAEDQAARIAAAAGDVGALARAENGRGHVLLKQQRYDEALAALYRARDLMTDVGDPPLGGMVTNNIGRVLRGTGRLDEAAQAHRSARAVFAALGDREGEATCRNEGALVLADHGLFAAAAGEQRAVLAVLRGIGARYREAIVSHDLGLSLEGLAEHEEAAAAYEHAASIFAELGADYQRGLCDERLAAIRALSGPRGPG